MYEFMGTLAESRLIPSVASLRQFRANELADLTVLYICSMHVLFSGKQSKQSKQFTMQYARRTIQHGTDFETWYGGETDLYVLLYGLIAPDVKLEDQHESDAFRKIVPLGEPLLVRWLKEMNTGHIRPTTHRALFSRLDFNFKTTNSSIRAVRRLIMDWDDLSHHEQSLAMTRLLQLVKNRAPKSELLTQLRTMASHHDLEITDVCDVETGEGCATDEPETKKKGSVLVNLAAFAAGVAVANTMDRKKK
jgi:hypothetical protein